MTSSDNLMRTFRRTHAGSQAAVLTGNLGDFHLGPEGAVVAFEQFLAYAAAADNRATIRWSPAAGTTQDTPPGRAAISFRGPGPGTEPADALRAITGELTRTTQPVTVVIDWTDGLCPNGGERMGPAIELLARAAVDPVLINAGHRFAIIDRLGTLNTLCSFPGFRSVPVPFPDLAERETFLRLIDARRPAQPDRFAPLAPETTIEAVAYASGGLSLRRLHSVSGELAYTGETLCPATVEPVKRAYLLDRSEGALRPMSTVGVTFDQIAGLPNVHLFVQQALAAGGLPLHVLLAGPPGVGKSLCVQAMATALGLPVIILGDVRSQWLGESERRMRFIIQMLNDVGPVMLFVDEIDQVLSDGDNSGDSGVSGRLNAMFWEWTGDLGSDRRVVVVGATNRPTRMGSRVEDRFTVIPVLHPDATQAAEILALTAARHGRTVDRETAMELVEGAGKTLSGRTLVRIHDNAVTIARRRTGGSPSHLNGDALAEALRQIPPSAANAEHEHMALEAIKATMNTSYYPWEAAKQLGTHYRPPAYIEWLLNADGTLDHDALNRRMQELECHGRL